VGLDGDTIYVDFVDFGFMLGDVRPISLTPEILEKNGFENKSRQTIKYIVSAEFSSIYISYWNRRLSIMKTDDYRKKHNRNRIHIDCNYVHELQHALRLCGIEKEIEI
jgi:hypothetical protein